MTNSTNQFPKLKVDNGELSKAEIKTIGSSEVEIDSAFCKEQLIGSEVEELVTVVKTNDVPSRSFQEGNKKQIGGVAEKAKFITSSLVGLKKFFKLAPIKLWKRRKIAKIGSL